MANYTNNDKEALIDNAQFIRSSASTIVQGAHNNASKIELEAMLKIIFDRADSIKKILKRYK